MLSFLLLACTSSPSNSPETKKEAPKIVVPKKLDSPIYTLKKESKRAADKVACADIDSDGIDEEIYVHNGTLYWGENREPLTGSFQTFHRGTERFLFATGFGKEFRDAPTQLYALDSSGIQKLWEKDGSRNQISSISEQDGKVFLSTFSEGTLVQGGWLEDGKFNSISELKMAMYQVPLGDSVVIGRLYGDEPRANGDLRVLTGAKETALPTYRGVKTLLVHDLNQDSHPDILVSDGWHYQYASQGKARVQVYLGPDYKDVRTLANFDEDYTVSRIEAHRNGTDYLIQGSKHVYLLQQTKHGFKRTEISTILETGSASFCYKKDQTAILVSGNPSQLIQLEPTQ